MRGRPKNTERIGKMTAARLSGKTFAELGVEFGISRQAAQQIFSYHGIPGLPSRKRKQYPSITTSEIIAEHKAGLSCRAIGEKLGMSGSAVSYRIRTADREVRRKRTHFDEVRFSFD